jgi:tRNA pseudouridine32 synthase / 23S rRNA pseudouridine746 synthase
LKNDRFHPLNNTFNFSLPEKFTFPFYYQAHPLAILAANELQDYLTNQQEWKHNFGLETENNGLIIGKMFGVLVVQNTKNKLGFLASYSGKLANSNEHSYFVPPVYDMLQSESFFKKEEEKLNELNKKISFLKSNEEIGRLLKELRLIEAQAEREIGTQRDYYKKTKKARAERKLIGEKTLSKTDFENLLVEQREESLKIQYFLKILIHEWKEKIEKIEDKITVFTSKIDELKEERKNRSNKLQPFSKRN